MNLFEKQINHYYNETNHALNAEQLMPAKKMSLIIPWKSAIGVKRCS